MTQAEIAEIMQWARTSVANCLALKNICPEAWQIVVVTTKASAVTDGNTEVVTPNATTVTFTEHVLRSITCLTAEQHLWLVKSLVAGKMDKTRFKAIAENANARNGWRTEAARG